MKNSSDTIENRTFDLPARSAVPQPTAPSYNSQTFIINLIYHCLANSRLLAKILLNNCATVDEQTLRIHKSVIGNISLEQIIVPLVLLRPSAYHLRP